MRTALRASWAWWHCNEPPAGGGSRDARCPNQAVVAVYRAGVYVKMILFCMVCTWRRFSDLCRRHYPTVAHGSPSSFAFCCCWSDRSPSTDTGINPFSRVLPNLYLCRGRDHLFFTDQMSINFLFFPIPTAAHTFYSASSSYLRARREEMFIRALYVCWEECLTIRMEWALRLPMISAVTLRTPSIRIGAAAAPDLPGYARIGHHQGADWSISDPAARAARPARPAGGCSCDVRRSSGSTSSRQTPALALPAARVLKGDIPEDGRFGSIPVRGSSSTILSDVLFIFLYRITELLGQILPDGSSSSCRKTTRQETAGRGFIHGPAHPGVRK